MDNLEDKFSILIRENKDKIFRICCCYLSDEEERKDLYQETMFNLWKGFKSFRKEAAFSTWAFRITVNTALYYLSRKKSQKKRISEYLSLRVQCDEQSDKSEIENLTLLYNAISQLPLIDLIIMSLVLEGLKSKEIAQIIGITDSNVRVRVARAKETLKKNIEGGTP